MSELKLSLIIDGVNRASGPIRKIIGDINHAGRVINKFSRLRGLNNATSAVLTNLSATSREAGRLTARLGILSGVTGFAFKRQFVDTASDFEKFQTILRTTEGSSEAAQRSMEWISLFATKTPFELAEVTNSFVKLRAFGLDPTQGLLMTLGDTASAMGKPVIQTVEAIADAVTGENERLKEFGIKAFTKGNKTRFEFTDKEGNQQFKIVDKNNRAMVQSTLQAIWNEKYEGSMERLSKTWIGMTSNISDQWTRFVQKVMGSGLFDWMKNKLSKFLDQIDNLAASGKLDQLAGELGNNIKKTFIILFDIGRALLNILKPIASAINFIADALGGYKNLIAFIAILMGGKFLLAVIATIKSLWILGVTIMPVVIGALKTLAAVVIAHPILLLVAGLAASAFLIVKNWSTVKQFWEDMIGHMTDRIESLMSKIHTAFDLVKQLKELPGRLIDVGVSNLPNSVRGFFSQDASVVKQQSVQTINSTSQNNVSGTIKVEINSEGKAKVKQVESKNRDVNFDVDAGLVMVNP